MIPKPFKRPSVEIGMRIARRWVTTEVGSLSEGDIVQDKGLIEGIGVGPTLAQVLFASGEVFLVNPAFVVRAFTEGASVGNVE